VLDYETGKMGIISGICPFIYNSLNRLAQILIFKLENKNGCSIQAAI
jgi:hypothetical protein